MDQRKRCFQSSRWRPCCSCYCEQKDRTSAPERCQYVVIPRSRARLTQGHRGWCWICFSFRRDDTVEQPSPAQPLILSYIVCAVVSTINYLIEFEWALAILSGGETTKQPAWVETVAQTPAQNSYQGSSFLISFSAGFYWNDGSNIVVHVHLWAGLLIPHWIEHKIKMAAREWGLLKKMEPTRGVSCWRGDGPGTSRAARQPASAERVASACVSLRLPTFNLMASFLWRALFSLHFFLLHSLVPSKSLCPQAVAIRCCQGHPFLKIVWCGSPSSFADRGHTCMK